MPDADALQIASERNPWRDVSWRAIAAVAVPFWLYITLTNVLYGLLVAREVMPEDIAGRFMQFLVQLPLLILFYKLALHIGWRGPHRWGAIAAQVLLAVVFAVSGRFILWVTFSLVMLVTSGMTSARKELIPEQRMIGASMLSQLLQYCAGLAILMGVLAFRRLREVTLRAERAEREYITARLQALRGQLNPHFLFNTLHSVCGLIDERPGTERTMLVRLGDLLRSSFRDEGEQVTLSAELELVRSYLEIQKLRFSDRLTFHIDVEVGLESAAVPRFVLQPLAENAIMHGMADERDHVTIRIGARRVAGALELSVVNSSSIPARQVQELGVGLGNTAERLRALYSERATLQFEPDGSSGFVVSVRLPIEPVSEAATA
jgi:sensor histidine kinase YesM